MALGVPAATSNVSSAERWERRADLSAEGRTGFGMLAMIPMGSVRSMCPACGLVMGSGFLEFDHCVGRR